MRDKKWRSYRDKCWKCNVPLDEIQANALNVMDLCYIAVKLNVALISLVVIIGFVNIIVRNE